MNTSEGLRSTLDIRHQNGLWADLRIVNEGRKTVSIHNPGSYLPTERWEFSREAYNVAVLLSFHFLEMALTRADGIPVGSRGIATLADHTVEPPVVLKPQDALTISIPLHEFYHLESGVTYTLDLTYGDDALKVHARRQFHL